MTDNDIFANQHNAGVKNNMKVDSLLLKSLECNQRCPLLGVSRSGHIQYYLILLTQRCGNYRNHLLSLLPKGLYLLPYPKVNLRL